MSEIASRAANRTLLATYFSREDGYKWRFLWAAKRLSITTVLAAIILVGFSLATVYFLAFQSLLYAQLPNMSAAQYHAIVSTALYGMAPAWIILCILMGVSDVITSILRGNAPQ